MMNLKTLLLAALLFFPAMPDLAKAEDDPDHGSREVGSKFARLQSEIEACGTCHGPLGAAPIDPTYPVLAGQHLYYIYSQLKDFKSGRRENEIMGPIAAAMEKKDMLLIAEYFSLQEWPANQQQVDDASAKIAESTINSGQCVQCHLGGFKGNSGVPRLSGQNSAYLEKTLLDFKNRVRNNAPDKASLMEAMSIDRLKATAQYLGAQ